MSLHDQLQQLADTAPRPAIDHAVWDRGRALRRRDRIVTSAVVLAIVVILGGFVAVVTGPPRAFAPAGDTVPEGAIPSRIYTDVPEDLVEGPDPTDGEVSWSDEVAEEDLAIGQASAAFAARAGSLPVVIGAKDGAYHHLDLPGWLGVSRITQLGVPSGLALSPDGTQLAYAWWDATDPEDASMPGGVRVVELASGEIRTVTLKGGNGIHVRAISWSPDSRWLAWAGVDTAAELRPGGYSTKVGGRIGPGASISATVPVGSNVQGAVAVTNSGTLVFAGGERVTVTAEGTTSKYRVDRDLMAERVATASPDGSVAIGSFAASDVAVFLDPETGVVTPRELAKDLERYPNGAYVQPLGWPTSDLVLSMVNPAGRDELSSSGNSELIVMTSPSRSEDVWTYRVVGTVDDESFNDALSLSVAVDLIPDLDGTSSQELTHDFGEPDWPGQRDISWIIGLGVAAGLSVLYGLRWVWRRRTRLT
ncbi:WD40 repeat domain-containing protein [Nocardioides sp.]|uniref:WD40 repeat domain-containing protein n=1 Tax=Nocardioides sp. TaxID=35761 RepID=UPI002B89328E|nr:WD40 repeat domain-containing protein [Nocardioides sp.]HXH81153.1 WD40 repeat domain-containing protein [Nocardioides sp.]